MLGRIRDVVGAVVYALTLTVVFAGFLHLFLVSDILQGGFNEEFLLNSSSVLEAASDEKRDVIGGELNWERYYKPYVPGVISDPQYCQPAFYSPDQAVCSSQTVLQRIAIIRLLYVQERISALQVVFTSPPPNLGAEVRSMLSSSYGPGMSHNGGSLWSWRIFPDVTGGVTTVVLREDYRGVSVTYADIDNIYVRNKIHEFTENWLER